MLPVGSASVGKFHPRGSWESWILRAVANIILKYLSFFKCIPVPRDLCSLATSSGFDGVAATMDRPLAVRPFDGFLLGPCRS